MSVLWFIIVVLVVMWALGFAIHIGGGLIHLLLVIAIVIFLIDFINGRRL